MKNKKNPGSDVEPSPGEFTNGIEDAVDALFKLPLAEFTSARNDLAARLKRAGRGDDASLVKALSKPPVSAWAVNQLYWSHQEEFGQLLAAGQGVRQAQASVGAGGVSDLRPSLELRRESLSRLSELAAGLLRDAGHNPTPEAIHRINTTLEAVSAYATLPDGTTFGRLTRDLDPPGFDSLALLLADAASLLPAEAPASKAKEEPVSATPSQEGGSDLAEPLLADAPAAKAKEEPASAAPSQEGGSDLAQPVQEEPPHARPTHEGTLEEGPLQEKQLQEMPLQEKPLHARPIQEKLLEDKLPQEAAPATNLQKLLELEEARQARIAAAKTTLQEAEKFLTEATARSERLEAERHRADAEANRAAEELSELEERLKQASAAARDASERSQRIAAEAKEAARVLEDARQGVGRASKDLESLF